MLSIPQSLVKDAFTAFVVSIIVGLLLSGAVLKGLIALKSRQDVYNLAPESHQKKQGTPTMGGIIILLGFIASLLVLNQDWKMVLWAIGFAFIGFTDDFVVPRMMKGKRGLGWKQKIVPQIVLAVLATPVFGLPVQVWPVVVTAFLVLFFSNAYNFADGLDGMAGSLGVLLCFGFGAMAQIEGQSGLLAAAAGLAGAFIPFLILNAPPAKVFMGDVGSLPIGAVFGGFASRILISPTPGGTGWNWAVLLPLCLLSFVMIAELLPVPMQVGYYKLTKKRLFPMTPIHHSFEKKGWPESRVVWSFVLTQFCLAVIAVAWVATTPMMRVPGETGNTPAYGSIAPSSNLNHLPGGNR